MVHYNLFASCLANIDYPQIKVCELLTSARLFSIAFKFNYIQQVNRGKTDTGLPLFELM